jgi:hypothetical protein
MSRTPEIGCAASLAVRDILAGIALVGAKRRRQALRYRLPRRRFRNARPRRKIIARGVSAMAAARSAIAIAGMHSRLADRHQVLGETTQPKLVEVGGTLARRAA